MKKMIYKTIPFITLLFLGMCIINCGSYQRADNQTKEMIAAIHTLLISEKLCSDENDCRIKNYVLCRPEKGAYIYIYGITNKKIITKIVDLFIEQHAKYPNIHYQLTIYSLTKEEDMKNLKQKKIILELILNKEN